MKLFVLFFTLTITLFASNITHFAYEGAINPASNAFVKKSIKEANKQNSQLIIFELNTPGGLLSSTRNIVSQILNSKIPVTVYISPKGSRAASAGTFILYASHIAVMSEGTNIGAATPVQIGFSEEKNNAPFAMQTKAINDASAYIESLAKLRNRNIQWAKQSVSKGASIDSLKAQELGVVDFIANDLDSLLTKLDGFEFQMDKKIIKLDTKNSKVHTVEEGFKIKILSYLSNPSIAYGLMLLAIYGIFFELMSPGSIFPGVIGLISGSLALYSLNILPFETAGLLLILIGIILMVAEVFILGFGILGIGGIIAFIFGSLILFDEKTLGIDISLSLIIAFALVSTAIFIYLLKVIIKEKNLKVKTGSEELIGSCAKVIKKKNDIYKVEIHSEVWNAKSKEEIQVGKEVIVENIDGLILEIKPKKE